MEENGLKNLGFGWRQHYLNSFLFAIFQRWQGQALYEKALSPITFLGIIPSRIVSRRLLVWNSCVAVT